MGKKCPVLLQVEAKKKIKQKKVFNPFPPKAKICPHVGAIFLDKN
jgi:hypothetical protein